MLAARSVLQLFSHVGVRSQAADGRDLRPYTVFHLTASYIPVAKPSCSKHSCVSELEREVGVAKQSYELLDTEWQSPDDCSTAVARNVPTKSSTSPRDRVQEPNLEQRECAKDVDVSGGSNSEEVSPQFWSWLGHGPGFPAEGGREGALLFTAQGRGDAARGYSGDRPRLSGGPSREGGGQLEANVLHHDRSITGSSSTTAPHPSALKEETTPTTDTQSHIRNRTSLEKVDVFGMTLPKAVGCERDAAANAKKGGKDRGERENGERLREGRKEIKGKMENPQFCALVAPGVVTQSPFLPLHHLLFTWQGMPSGLSQGHQGPLCACYHQVVSDGAAASRSQERGEG
ncbi:unnamed protein product [Pleuronectes platessa]|uniref:Uncharacterized protein n=1 Tax=Pleuronectes platessa TaxID=8262 RepID=A0A9N7V6V0_PLEPL|nr:unnamed protein product [Pleuronectes platessa]